MAADSISGVFEYPASMDSFRRKPFVTLDQLTAGEERGGDEIAFRYRSKAGNTVRQGHVLAVAKDFSWVKILTARSGNPATFTVENMTSGVRLLNKAQ